MHIQVSSLEMFLYMEHSEFSQKNLNKILNYLNSAIAKMGDEIKTLHNIETSEEFTETSFERTWDVDGAILSINYVTGLVVETSKSGIRRISVRYSKKEGVCHTKINRKMYDRIAWTQKRMLRPKS